MVSIYVLLLIQFGLNMTKKIILTAYIENTQLRKENQAILQTLETGVI